MASIARSTSCSVSFTNEEEEILKKQVRFVKM